MKRMKQTIQSLRLLVAGTLLCAVCSVSGQTGANPNIPFYGSGGVITATPAYPIVGENTHIAVTVGNNGSQAAANVRVKISFNDWGVTFSGWQEIGTITIPTIPAGGSALAEIDYVFQQRTHTCLEALIVGADQNDDPNDDRGQINLEVINAGETFSYWVPIVNNGDAPLDLLLMGHCKGADGTADQAQVRCKEDVDRVHLEPGDEILVPIELDLADVLPGQEVVFVLDAFDLGAADPFAPANHNHVELRIVRETARHLKKTGLTALNGMAPQVADRALRNRIEQTAKHIQQALTDAWWTDDNHLANDAAQVFAQEQAAVNHLVHLLETDLPLPVKTALNQIALQLTDADRILAETANRAAGGVAQDLINDGDAHRMAGDYSEAVNSYKHAWQMASP